MKRVKVCMTSPKLNEDTGKRFAWHWLVREDEVEVHLRRAFEHHPECTIEVRGEHE
jgi:hypothetical protein